MQCYSDLNLKCSDCKSTFTSATKLLQHFADHVNKEARSKFKCFSASTSKTKKRSNTAMNANLVQTESGSDSSQSHHESTLSASSEPLDSCSESSGYDQSQSCKLAKFDLQKRLESCVSDLASKQELDSSNNDNNLYFKQEQDKNEHSSLTNCSIADTKASEEYSAVKFCMITMEENDEKFSVNSSPKKIASRKQLLPKKIERKMEGLRKLAPKPESSVVSTDLISHSSGKKKYSCHLCTKVFGWSTDLKRHILVHTGERPFKCKTCQATFTRNFLLQKHQSKVHPCKPKELVVKPEHVEMPNISITNSDEEILVDPLKEEPVEESNECDNEDDDDDDDDGKLVITEEVQLNTSLPNCSSDSKWHVLSTNSDRRCSDLNQPDMFNINPVKV